MVRRKGIQLGWPEKEPKFIPCGHYTSHIEQKIAQRKEKAAARSIALGLQAIGTSANEATKAIKKMGKTFEKVGDTASGELRRAITKITNAESCRKELRRIADRELSKE